MAATPIKSILYKNAFIEKNITLLNIYIYAWIKTLKYWLTYFVQIPIWSLYVSLLAEPYIDHIHVAK